MLDKSAIVPIPRDWNGTSEIKVQDDEIRMEPRIPRQEPFDLLRGSRVSDAGIDDFYDAALAMKQPFQTLRDRLFERHAPSFDERIAEHHDASDARLSLDWNLT